MTHEWHNEDCFRIAYGTTGFSVKYQKGQFVASDSFGNTIGTYSHLSDAKMAAQGRRQDLIAMRAIGE